MRFSMFNQTQITNYFKFVDQSNSTSINSRKFSFFISCFCSTSRFCSSVNRITETSQHQHIATDETSSLKTQQKFKSDVFISNSSSTSRVCFSINQNARISHIAFETNFTSLIKSTKASSLEIQQRIKIRVSIDKSKSKYRVAADVDYINKNIHVETSLTNAKKYNSNKSSIKRFKSFKSVVFINSFNSTFRFCFSINQTTKISQHQHIAIDEASSLKIQQKFKFNIFNSNFSSTSRICFSVNQNARISHIALDEILSSISCRSFKFFNSVIFSNSFNSTLRFCLLINSKSIMSQILVSIYEFQIFQSADDLRLNRVFAFSNNNTSLSSSLSYASRYSRRNDVERKKKNNVTSMHWVNDIQKWYLNHVMNDNFDRIQNII